MSSSPLDPPGTPFDNSVGLRQAFNLAWLVGFAIFFLSFDLPNNRPVTRWQVLQIAPAVLIEAAWPLPQPGGNPSGWEFLPQRLPAMLTAAAILLAAFGFGRFVLRRTHLDAVLNWPERIAFAGGVGLSLWSLTTLGIGLVGWQHPAIAWTLIAVGVAAAVAEFANSLWVDRRHQTSRDSRTISFAPVPALILIISAIILWAMLLGACTPQSDFDVLAYHLNGPKEWFLRGKIEFLPHNVYTSFPFLTEMLLLSGMTALGDWHYGALAGQVVLMAFAPLTALALFGAGRRWFGDSAGWLAALVWLTTPWTYRISIIAYAEGGLSFYLAASFIAACRAATAIEHRFAWLGLTGFLAGSAMACKYPGLTSVVLPIGLGLTVVWLRQRIPVKSMLKFAAAHGLGVLLAVGPWVVKNAVETGNPVYPLAYSVFGGRDLDDALAAKWERGHAAQNYETLAARGLDFIRKFTDVIANNDWHSPLLYGLAPLSLWWIARQRGASSACLLAPAAEERVREIGRTLQPSSSPLAPAAGERARERGRTLQPTSESGSSSLAGDTHRKSVLIAAWLYLGWLFLTWFFLTHHIDRFWIPMIPIAALLAGAGAATFITNLGRVAAGTIISVLIGLNLAICAIPEIGGYNSGLTDLNVAERIAANAMTPEIRWLNDEWKAGRLPADFKLLCVGEAATFHAEFPVVYNSVFDRSILEEWCAEQDGTLRPAEDIRRTFQNHGVTHVFVSWRWVATYREPGNYGFTDFVHPDTFRALQAAGILGSELRLPDHLAYAPMSDDRRQLLETWAPELIVRRGGEPMSRAAQVLSVE